MFIMMMTMRETMNKAMTLFLIRVITQFIIRLMKGTLVIIIIMSIMMLIMMVRLILRGSFNLTIGISGQSVHY